MEAIISLINSSDIPDELKTKLVAQAEAEKKTYDTRYSGKDQEALKLKHTLKSIGYDKDKYESYEKFGEYVKTELTNSKTELEGTKTQNQEILQKLGDLEEKFAAKEVSEAEALKKGKIATIRKELSERLSKTLISHNAIVDSEVLGKLENYEIDGDKITFKDGENSLSIDDYVKSIEENNKPLLKAEQEPGGGGGAGDGGIGDEEYEKLEQQMLRD